MFFGRVVGGRDFNHYSSHFAATVSQQVQDAVDCKMHPDFSDIKVLSSLGILGDWFQDPLADTQVLRSLNNMYKMM